MRAPCSIPGCEKPSRGRGWCGTHWRRWRTHGDPLKVARSGVDYQVKPTCSVFDGAGQRRARGDDGRFVTLPHDSGQRAGVIL